MRSQAVAPDSDWFPVRITAAAAPQYTFQECWLTADGLIADRVGGRVNTTSDAAYAIDGSTFTVTVAGAAVQAMARRGPGAGGTRWELRGSCCCDPLNSSFRLRKKISVAGDFVVVGKSTRNSGGCTFTLSYSGTPVLALLYYNLIGGANLTAPLATLNGVSVAGDCPVAKSGDTCWGVVANRTFAVDVTSQVAASGPGQYILAGLPFDATAGQANVGTECGLTNYPGAGGSNGATMIIVYDNVGPTRDVSIYEGGVIADTIINVPATAPFASDGHIAYVIGDAQNAGSIGKWNGGTLGTGQFANCVTGGTMLSLREFTGMPVIAANTAQVTPGNDCLYWFMFAMSKGS